MQFVYMHCYGCGDKVHKTSVYTLLFSPKQNTVNKGRRGW